MEKCFLIDPKHRYIRHWVPQTSHIAPVRGSPHISNLIGPALANWDIAKISKNKYQT
jgi:hypothetical protein